MSDDAAGADNANGAAVADAAEAPGARPDSRTGEDTPSSGRESRVETVSPHQLSQQAGTRTPEASVRPVTAEDLPAVLAMKNRSWRTAYAHALPAEEFDRIDAAMVLAGTGLSEGDLPERELFAVYLDERVYGTGLADRLLREVLGDAPAVLWVLDGNARAEAFYRRHGFEALGAPAPLGGSWGEHSERLYVRR